MACSIILNVGTFASFGIGCIFSQTQLVSVSYRYCLAILTAVVIVGGIKRIGAFRMLVPFMAALYILVVFGC